MPLPFLDTNILLRHLTQDHSDLSPRATAYLERIQTGQLRVRSHDIVIFETVFTLQSFYRVPKADIRDKLLPLLLLPGIVLPRKKKFQTIFQLYVDRNMKFVDAYIVVEMQRLRLADIISFDQDFDKLPGITRIEP